RGNLRRASSALRTRPRPAQAFCLLILGAQLYFVVRAYRDPHKHFGYQPFGESSTWSADLFRVLENGQRESIRDGWAGYRWEELVRVRVGSLCLPRPAEYGIASPLDFLQKALDWVAAHTPADHETLYLEAHVSFVRNRRGPYTRVLRSALRKASVRAS